MNETARIKIQEYINHNPIATLGTINDDGTPHGAAVYVYADQDSTVYFLTKSETTKCKNVRTRPHVSITIVNPSKNSTLQASGEAFEVNNAKILDTVMHSITQIHASAGEWLPPIVKLRVGVYVMIGVKLKSARLADFTSKSIGDEDIFTQL